MRIENGRLVFDKKACSCCKEGKTCSVDACPECKGTGRGKRGKVGGCRKCNGSRKYYNWERKVTCDICHGNYQDFQDETVYDYIPKGLFASMPFKVVRQYAGQSFNEQYLGLGMVFGCTDYGAAWGRNDADIIADVKTNYSHQACKIAKEDGTLAKGITIVVKPQGYSVVAEF